MLEKADQVTAAPVTGKGASLSLKRALFLLLGFLAFAVLLALSSGYQSIDWMGLRTDEVGATILFQIRLPRVLLGVLVGASLAVVGAALQALFRNPLADPFILGVSGGGALGASVAIVLGAGASIAGVPLVFIRSVPRRGGGGVRRLQAGIVRNDRPARCASSRRYRPEPDRSGGVCW